MALPLMSRRREVDALENIRSLAQSISRKIPYAGPSKQPQLPTPSPHTLNLPSPEPLTSKFVSLGIDVDSARRISSAFVHVAEQFKESCETSYRLRLRALQARALYFQDAKFYSSLSSAYGTLYKRSLQSWSSYLSTTIVPRVLRAQASLNGGSPFQRKRSFNQSAIPVLERFFETNAFPSRLEKCELASDCDMDFKQINVWFQNRRSRCRKEGKELRRRNSDDDFLRALEDSVADTLLPPMPQEEESAGDTVDLDAIQAVSILSPRPPPHAFPTPYPPLCSEDPFPSSPTKRALKLPWLRQPTSEIRVTPPVDLCDMIACFAKLSITDASPTDDLPIRRSAIEQQSLRDAVGFVTPCPCAPHPALVRRPRRYARGTCSASLQSCVPSTPTRRRKPTFPNTSSSITCISSAGPSSATRRPKRGLPRRIPQHSPRCTETTVLPEFPTVLRASSVTSMSSSSSRSDTESPPSTPTSHFDTFSYGCDPLIFDQSEELGTNSVFDFLKLSSEQLCLDDIKSSNQRLLDTPVQLFS